MIEVNMSRLHYDVFFPQQNERQDRTNGKSRIGKRTGIPQELPLIPMSHDFCSPLPHVLTAPAGSRENLAKVQYLHDQPGEKVGRSRPRGTSYSHLSSCTVGREQQGRADYSDTFTVRR